MCCGNLRRNNADKANNDAYSNSPAAASALLIGRTFPLLSSQSNLANPTGVQSEDALGIVVRTRFLRATRPLEPFV